MATQSESTSVSITIPTKPWILLRQAEINDVEFGAKTEGWWFIEGDYGGHTVISLNVEEWPEQLDENGEYHFKLLLQEEGDRYHNVCQITLVLDANYKFIREELYDKYDDCFKVGWSGVYSFIRWSAGCPDWYSRSAAGLPPIQIWNPHTESYGPELDIEQNYD